MIPEIFKTMGLLFFILEQTAIPIYSTHFSGNNLLSSEQKFKKTQYNATYEKASQDKQQAYNIRSGNTIGEVAENAIDSSEALILCDHPDAGCVTPEPLPIPTVVPDQKIINPTRIPEPEDYPVTTILPTPAVSPILPISPEPTGPIVIDPQPCPLPCDIRGIHSKDIQCVMLERPCRELL